MSLPAYSDTDDANLPTSRRVRLKGTRQEAPPPVPRGRPARALRQVELTDTQIDALVSAAELAEAAWWDDPALQRRLAALTRARRTLADTSRRRPLTGSSGRSARGT